MSSIFPDRGLFPAIAKDEGVSDWAKAEGLDPMYLGTVSLQLIESLNREHNSRNILLVALLFLLLNLSGCAPQDGSICPGGNLPDHGGRVGCFQLLPEFLQKLLVGDSSWSASPGAIDLRPPMDPDENGQCPHGMQVGGVLKKCIADPISR